MTLEQKCIMQEYIDGMVVEDSTADTQGLEYSNKPIVTSY